MATPTQEVTRLLMAWGQGERAALDELIPLVHQELRRLAHRYMAGERSGHTLQTTALVNEAYVRLVDCRKVRWQDRTHFFGVSAQLMRRILVDHARARLRARRGGGALRVSLEQALLVSEERSPLLVALDDALNALSALDPRQGRVVELRFFGGLSTEETAEVLKISSDSVKRDWRLAKAWLMRELSGAEAL